ncbi:MAG: hypothetical protein ACE5K4_07255 [Candidatus Hydrothermarchaeota archaeon]
MVIYKISCLLLGKGLIPMDAIVVSLYLLVAIAIFCLVFTAYFVFQNKRRLEIFIEERERPLTIKFIQKIIQPSINDLTHSEAIPSSLLEEKSLINNLFFRRFPDLKTQMEEYNRKISNLLEERFNLEVELIDLYEKMWKKEAEIKSIISSKDEISSGRVELLKRYAENKISIYHKLREYDDTVKIIENKRKEIEEINMRIEKESRKLRENLERIKEEYMDKYKIKPEELEIDYENVKF